VVHAKPFLRSALPGGVSSDSKFVHPTIITTAVTVARPVVML